MSGLAGSFPPGSPSSDDEEPGKGRSVASLGNWAKYHFQRQGEVNVAIRNKLLAQRNELLAQRNDTLAQGRDIKRILDILAARQPPPPSASPSAGQSASSAPAGNSALVPIAAAPVPLLSSPPTSSPPTSSQQPTSGQPAALTSEERFARSKQEETGKREREHHHQRLNFDCPPHVPHDTSYDTATALGKSIWPRATTSVDEAVTNKRNTVVFRPEWTVLQKLQQIQSFVVGQIPYD